MKRILFVLPLFLCLNAQANSIADWFFVKSQFTVLAGTTWFGPTDDGTWVTQNRQRNVELTKTAYGLRWDSDRVWSNYSFGLQYTNFGTVNSDALAPGADHPYAGGYIPRTSQCVGECKPNHRWITRTDTQSIALIGTRHFGGFSVDLGANYAYIHTEATRYVGCTTNDPNCVPPTLLDKFQTDKAYSWGSMVGLTYRQGPWSIRGQVWMPLEGKGDIPSVFTGNAYTLLAGYSF